MTTDLFAYCKTTIPKWNTISISGYHFREKGASAVQEVAFTLANGIAYVQAAIDAGLEVDEFAPRLAFFFNGHNNVFQEVAKFRAARRMWAQIMRERFGAQDERSWKLRFHTQTGGVTLTAQQPENNIVRVALQGFAAVCGGTQSLHTNGFDEALALPTENAAKIAVRTQQILAYESGVGDTVDPFAGSYFVESLTEEIEQRATELIARVDELGGAVAAIDFMKAEIEESAFGYHERYRTEQDIVVGVNRFVEDDVQVPEIMRVDPAAEHDQVTRLKAFKENRDPDMVAERLDHVRAAARGSRQHPARSCARRSRTAARSARSAARCATSSAVTNPPIDSLAQGRTLFVPAVFFWQIALAVHVVFVVTAFGVVVAYPLIAIAAERLDPRSAPMMLRLRQLIGRSLVNPGLLIVVIAGVYLASSCTNGASSMCSGGSAPCS